MVNAPDINPIPTTPPPPTLTKTKTKPPFTPHTKTQGVARPVTPDSDLSSDNNNMPFSLALLPKGHQLVVCGIVPVSNKTPAATIKDFLISLESDPCYSDFADFGLIVLLFSDHALNILSACYVETLSSGEAEPCVDLLEIVMEAIAEAKPEWEVRWSAGKKGRSDKCLSCHLLDLYPGVTDRSAIPPDHLPLIKAHMEKMGFKIASIFTSFSGSQITFLLPSDTDCFNAKQFIDVPAKVSKERARIEPLKEIPIFRPFELVVKGAWDFDLLEGVLEKWIRKTVPHSLVETCVMPLNTNLIFTMSTWDDTTKIMRSADSFNRLFHNQLSVPHLLWDFNDNPLNKNSLGDQVAKGASQISGNVASLSRQIQELQGKVMVMRHQQEDLATNQTKMSHAISKLDFHMSQTQQAILIQGQECLLCSQLSDDESKISSLRVASMFSSGEAKEGYNRMIVEFEILAADKREHLSKFTNQLAAVTGHPLLPPPSPSTSTSHRPPSVSGPQGLSTSHVLCSTLSPVSILSDPDPAAQADLMEQDGDTVSTNSTRFLFSPSIYMGVQCISDEPDEIAPTLTCVVMLKADHDARLAQRRRSSPHGTTRHPVYIAPSFPAFSSFHIFDSGHILQSSCYEEPAVLPSIPSTVYIGDPPVNCAPVSQVATFNFLYRTEPPCLFFCAMVFHFRLCLLIPFLVLLLFVNTTMAMPTFAQSELSVCALNANGLMSPVMLAIISPLLMKLAPHFFALSETKTRTNAASNPQISNYEVFEKKAIPCAAPSCLAKWGIILDVQKDLQIVARVPLNHELLKGQVVCVDVVVPSLSSSSTSFIHRVFAVYAPCDPSADDLSLNFWPCLMNMVQESKTSWSIFGDLNATIASFERASDNVLA
jgi:hypothetical protein